MDFELNEELLKNTYDNLPMKKLAEGGMSYAYEIDGKIIRIPKTQYALDGYLMEKAILDYIPNIVKSVDLPKLMIIEQPFFHTEHKKIEGRYWTENEYMNRPEKERDELAYGCAVFFSELHSVEISKINSDLRDLHPIRKNMETYLSDYFTASEIEKTEKYTNQLFELKNKVLIHNDFYYDNFLLDENYKLKAVLDFGNSGVFDYHFDFKKLDTHEKGERDLFERIARYYTQITGRIIDREVIKIIGIHNYVSFLVYFTKNADIKDEKINARADMARHVQHIKDRIKCL